MMELSEKIFLFMIGLIICNFKFFLTEYLSDLYTSEEKKKDFIIFNVVWVILYFLVLFIAEKEIIPSTINEKFFLD